MTTLQFQTTVLPGHRVEISNPNLPDGTVVQVTIAIPEGVAPRKSLLEIAESLAPGPRVFPTWEEYEQHLREEKDAWER